jgi:hypothetical protein
MQAEIDRMVRDRGKELSRNLVAKQNAVDVDMSGVRLAFGFDLRCSQRDFEK